MTNPISKAAQVLILEKVRKRSRKMNLWSRVTHSSKRNGEIAMTIIADVCYQDMLNA